VANRSVVPFDRLVGLDRSQGMLRQARVKAPSITWIGADAAALPFRDGSFDFISCQFAFHHIEDKTRMLQEGFRVLRAEGCFVLRNLCPQECPDWLYYDYFPEARVRDFEDFWTPDAVISAMHDCGFGPVGAEREHLNFEEDLLPWLETVQRRDTCSQLLAISDNAYEAGLRRLTHELAGRSGPVLRDNHLCLVTIRGEKREIES
jgi:SAM-dependent methyltransferase